METQEIWKDIIGYEGLYQVSNLGRIKSLDRIIKHKNCLYNRKGKILIQSIRNCYKSVCLYDKEHKMKIISSHRLVAIHFIKNEYNKPCVNHIDSNKLNNRFDNLEWVTVSENSMHYNYSVRKINKKFSQDEINDIRQNCIKGLKRDEINSVFYFMKKYNCRYRKILKIINREQYSNI